jgi:AraC-like DNA-binding protein
MFYLGGIALALFLSLLLFTKRNRTAPDLLLASWLLLVTLHLLTFYSYETRQYPGLLGVGMPLPLIHGPFLYAYTRALTRRPLKLPVLLLHFLPALAIAVRLIPFFLLTTAEKLAIFDSHGAGYETFNTIRYIATVVSGILYVILSSLALRKHRRDIAEQFSNTDKINLAWLQYLIYWIGAIWLGVLASNDTWIFSTAVLFILFIGYFGIRQVGIFSPVDPGQEETDSEKRKYQRSGLTPETADTLHRNLSDLMSREKVFRESELSLAGLAARLNTMPNYLSQVINEREGKTFYDYINTLRVEEFKQVAAGPESRKYTLLGLALECGFSSKSTFNRHFRKVTGKAPSEFIPDTQS